MFSQLLEGSLVALLGVHIRSQPLLGVYQQQLPDEVLG